MKGSFHLYILMFLSLALGQVFTVTAAGLNILVIGSSKSYSDGKSDPEEDPAVKEKAFNPSTIATQLSNILSNDPAISGNVTVVPEDIYRSKQLDTAMGGSGAIWDFTYYCYSLMQYHMWPDGKDARLANLRGQGGTAWDYVIIMGDPYLMANMPGVYAEGVKLLSAEISSGTAEPILLAQWPENSSGFTATEFNEIVYRVGNSAGVRVVPAGKAWDTYGSQDSSANHPTPHGAYLAAASIYSTLYNRSAKTSSYTYGNNQTTTALSDHALSVVQANDGVSQYTGTYTTTNVFQMKYVTKRTVEWCEYGTSTEEGFSNGLKAAFPIARVNYVRRNGSVADPVDFTYSRGTDCFEADKQYDYQTRLDHGDRTYGFPIGDHSATGAVSMLYGIDKRYYGNYWFYNGTDLGIAYSMIMENQVPLDVRGTPVRLLWAKMNHANIGLTSHRDGWHLSNELDRAVGAYLFTMVSGRCPIEDEPADNTSTAWKQWLCRKIGYETAWQLSHVTARSPGFRVLPSATAALNINPSSTETMTVTFMYPPQNDVTVTITSSDTSIGVVGPQKLVFTPSNYNTPQAVTVAGVPGSPTPAAVNIQFSTASDDEVYDGLSDSWEYINNRTSSTVTHVDNGTSQYSTPKNFAVTASLNASGAGAANTVFAGPNHGSLAWNGSDVVYTPDTDYVGADGFAYWTLVNTTLTTGYIEIDVLDGFPAGSVRAEATDATATEEATTTGMWTITREGDTTSSLVVNFSLSGAAMEGVDYTLTTTSPVTIPAGQSSVVITLTPVDDSVFGEHDETAILTIIPGAGYSIVNPTATITIADNDNNAPTVTIHNDNPTTIYLVQGTGGGDPLAGAHYEWDASTDTNGNNTWESTGTTSYNWTFDSGAQTPTAIADPRFDRLTSAYDFPTAKDASNSSFSGQGDAEPATFEFVLDVDGLDGSIFETGGSGDGLQIDMSGGAIRGTVQESPPAQASYSLTPTDLGRFIHVVFVVDSAKDVVQLYVDGELKDSMAWTQVDWAGTDSASLGARAGSNPTGGATTDFSGKMALFRYYRNKAFTAAEVTTNFNSLSTGTSATVNLDATVIDPDETPTTLWTVVSGPAGAGVTFGDDTAVDTTATFTVAGTYLLRLTADDGFGPVYKECEIIVATGGGPIADVNLPAGISLYGYTGENATDASAAFQTLIDNSQLSLVRWVNPTDGQIKELYYTTFPSAGWVNEIGNLILGQGYVVKTTAACTLSITGNKSTASISHDLITGYSIIGYNKETPLDARTAFQPLIDAGKLELVRWVNPSNGQIKELYYTTFPSAGWVNEIGDLTEGQGYIIKLNAGHNGFVVP